MKTLIFMTLLALLASPVLAQIPPEETFPALGAPDDPKVDVRWNRFHDVNGLNRIVRQIHEAYPNLTRLINIGKSYQGRDMWILEVTNFSEGDPATKPAMYIDGNIHGNEVQGGEAVVYTAWYLTEMFGKVDRVTELLNTRAFYLLPTINPDGRDYWFHAENTPHSSRGGQVPVDNDRDGLMDEDGPEDLDGDGQITQMRIRDPWGRYKADPDFPEQLMVSVDRDERGEYTRLGWEGFDNDGDGAVNEDGPGGYDPNRNWPWAWQPEGVQYGARDYPFCLPESRNVSEYVLARPNIAACQSYHNTGGMILRGPGQDVGKVEPADESLAKFISDRGEAMLPFYESMVVWDDLYTVWGGEFEWFYGALGMISFTNEMFTSSNYYRREAASGSKGQQERADFVRYVLQEQGLTKWKEFEHPDYGTVEIGGTAATFGRVPPSFMLEEELHRNMVFTLYHAECMPLLAMGEPEVTSLGNGVHRVRVSVENHGVIPTRIAQDVKNNITPKNAVTITGADVLAGGIVTNPRLDSVSWQKTRPERILVDSVPGLNRVVVEFLVRGSGSVSAAAEAARGGTVSQTVSLP